ncbi:hypothetical protein BDZ91DRAFT_555290 [Kalaharituber pfeilii]|nr:hypothetical protein BDZ91DRAFT_555290 [Kalaharituber pfeilii]
MTSWTTCGNGSSQPARTRYPYYDNLLLPRHMLNPGHIPYTPSESTVSTVPPELHQHPDSGEGHSVIQALQTGLAIAEDSLQMKQRVIKQLEDSLQIKQATVDQLEGRIKQMENKQQGYKEKVEKLECDLASLRAEQEKSAIIAPKRIELRSATWRHNAIGIFDGRATFLISSSETFNMLSYPNDLVSFQSTTFQNKYLSADPSDFSRESSFGGNVTLCDRYDSKAMFRLHRTESGMVYIELLDFPGHFLKGVGYSGGGIKTVNSKIAEALFELIEK